MALRGLAESRLNLMLRGYNVQALERIVAAMGFVIAGLGGTLWSINSRIRPSMALEASLIGVATFIIGPMIAKGLWGLIITSLVMALLKLLMALFLEGDWAMTVPLIVFSIALLIYRGKLIFTVSGRGC